MIVLLTRRGRVTHICVSKLIIVGSDIGLSPGRFQAIIWANLWNAVMWTLGNQLKRNFNRKSYIFYPKKCIWTCCMENAGHFVWASIWWSLNYIHYLEYAHCLLCFGFVVIYKCSCDMLTNIFPYPYVALGQVYAYFSIRAITIEDMHRGSVTKKDKKVWSICLLYIVYLIWYAIICNDIF